MNTTEELQKIKTQIVHNIILVTIVGLSLVYVLSISRVIDFGYSPLFLYHTLLYFSVVFVYVYRKRIRLTPKIFMVASIYTLAGLLGLINLGLSGGHYYVIMGITILAILVRTRWSIAFIVSTLTFYCIYCLLLAFHIVEPKIDVSMALESPFHWVTQMFSIILTSIVFLLGFGNYYRHLTNTLNQKIEAESELSKMNMQLELLVQERTEELETTNEELQTSNEELFEKSEIINQKNVELEEMLHDLKEAQTNLLHADKMASLGVLTAGVAHEINNPLNYIMGAYEGLKRHTLDNQCCMNHEHVSTLLECLHTGIHRASGIVQGLNEFSRGNHSKEEHINIIDIIDNCLTMLNNEFKHRIDIVKVFNHEEGIIVKGNVGQLHQVFINLLTNAIQAISDKGEIRISTSSDDMKITITIQDNGIGISQDNLRRVTEPFFTTKAPGKGTGLGLSITYNIIKEHFGQLQFESELNRGTTVIVTLPIKRANGNG